VTRTRRTRWTRCERGCHQRCVVLLLAMNLHHVRLRVPFDENRCGRHIGDRSTPDTNLRSALAQNSLMIDSGRTQRVEIKGRRLLDLNIATRQIGYNIGSSAVYRFRVQARPQAAARQALRVGPCVS
jgi:hypothetical protein